MEQAIQNILETNEEVKWEGKQDAKSSVVKSLAGIILIVAVGAFLYFLSHNTAGTCTVNGVIKPMSECNRFAKIGTYIMFIIAIMTPIFAYWRYKVTYYAITNKRVLIKSGFVGADINSIYYDRVHSIMVNVGVVGKIFGTGSVLIDTGKTIVTNNNKGGGSSTQVEYERFSNIKNPYDVYKIAQEMLNANKSALYGGKGM
jgi:uncharacterized membrane protein YdbT with pleckstrin-like domain